MLEAHACLPSDNVLADVTRLGGRNHPEAGDSRAALFCGRGHEMSEDPARLQVHDHASGCSALEFEFVVCSSSAIRLRDEEGCFRDAVA